MKNIVTTILFLLLLNTRFYSQNLNFNISGFNGIAVLQQIQGENLIFIDSLVSENNIITFKSKNLLQGVYRISFNKNKLLNFIYDGKNIEVKTDYSNILDSLKIIESKSNKLYYTFLKINKDYKTKTELLNIILNHYPKDDDYYKITQNKLTKIQDNYLKFIGITSQTIPHSFIARYIWSAQLPVIPQNITSEEQLNYLKSHALDNVDFNDAQLIYSNVFTNKTIEYLAYYRNPRLPKALLEKEFMKAVDTVLSKAKAHELVYQQITEYLIDGFKKFGFDKIINYIVENYVIKDDLCLDEQTENSIQRRINQSRILKVGTKAPNFIMPDKDRKVIDLSKIQSDKTLLVFYASWCPHCQKLFPRLVKWYKKQNGLKVLAISLDSKKEDWLKFVKDNKLNFININDPNGWDGNLASDYFIYATPTMFLLDSEKRIIGKPINYSELKSYFKNKY